MFGYCLGVKCVFPWDGICGSDLWDGWGQQGFNERLFDLWIGNWNVFSSCWFALFSNKVNTLYVPLFCPFFLHPRPCLVVVSLCLTFILNSIFLNTEQNNLNKLETVKREGKWRRIDRNLLCPSLSLSTNLPLSRWTREWGGKKHKQKENRLCSSIFSQSPDNSTAIDNQSLISLISLTYLPLAPSFAPSSLSFQALPCHQLRYWTDGGDTHRTVQTNTNVFSLRKDTHIRVKTKTATYTQQ